MTLTPDGYRPRLVDAKIGDYLRTFGAVCVEGPRFCGKTWASMNQCNSAVFLADPRDYNSALLARLDIRRIFDGDTPRLIDEWQEIPSIWDATRSIVDESRERGRFILTGSSTPVKKGIHHSGIGRIGTLQMRTMSLFESGDSSGKVSLRSLFQSSPENMISLERCELQSLMELTLRGGWPSNIDLKVEDAISASKVYLEMAVRDVSSGKPRSRSKKKVEMFIRSYARNESTLATDTKIAKDMDEFGESRIDGRTLDSYRGAMERLFLIEDQPAFDPNYRSEVRVGKSPKRHLTDPALSAAAMGMTTDKLMGDLNYFSLLFEAMCERDLQIYARASGGNLYHYRDASGREIDAVVEMPDGKWGAFEIKLGSHQTDAAAENLLSIRDYMDSKGVRRMPSVLGVVSGMETSFYRRDDGVYVIPITALRD